MNIVLSRLRRKPEPHNQRRAHEGNGCMRPEGKIVHMAGKINSKGYVSALCYAKSRKIDLTKESWTIRLEAVTCKPCKRLARKIPNPAARGGSQ